MKVMLPCKCEEEEHELEVHTIDMYSFEGVGEGDELPCGRILTKDDIKTVGELMVEKYYEEP